MFQDLVALMPWNSIMALINLALLTIGLKKFLFKPVMAVLEKRRAEIDKQYDAAEKAQTTAEQLRNEYEESLVNAKDEASEIVKSATARATQRSEEMLSTTRTEVAALKQKAREDIESEQRKAASQLKGDIADIALGIAGKVVEKEIDAKAHKKLIEDFISNVGDAS